MRDLHLWRLLQSPALDAAEAAPLLDQLAQLPLAHRAAYLGLLVPALTHADANVRAAAVRVLAGTSGRPALQRIVQALGDPERIVRLAAVETLRLSVQGRDWARWVHALFHPDADVRLAALDPGRDFPPPPFYKIFLLPDPVCRPLVEQQLAADTLAADGLPLLFDYVHRGLVPSEIARRLVRKASWNDWLSYLGDLMPRERDMLAHLNDAMQPDWPNDLMSHYRPDRLDDLIALLWLPDPPGTVESPHTAFFDLLWEVAFVENEFFRQWISFTFLGVAVQKQLWPPDAAALLAVMHLPFLHCPWVPEAVRRSALAGFYRAGQRCPKFPADQIRPYVDGPLCKQGDRFDLHAVGALLHTVESSPFACLIDWVGLPYLVAEYQSAPDSVTALLSLPDASSFGRLRLIGELCASAPGRHRAFASMAQAVPADHLDFLDSLDSVGACVVVGHLLDLEVAPPPAGKSRPFSENKIARLAKHLANKIAAGQVERFLAVWMGKPTPGESALGPALVARLVHDHQTRLLVPAAVRLPRAALLRFLDLIPAIAGMPYDEEIELARRLQTHDEPAIRSWALARLRSGIRSVEGKGWSSAFRRSSQWNALRRPPEGGTPTPRPPEGGTPTLLEPLLGEQRLIEDDEEPLAEPILRLGLCAQLEALADPVMPSTETCQALLASHDPAERVLGQLRRYLSGTHAFTQQLDADMVKHWRDEERLPLLGHAWLWRWEKHLDALATLLEPECELPIPFSDRSLAGLLTWASSLDQPLVSARLFAAAGAILERWRWHDRERYAAAWDVHLLEALLLALTTPMGTRAAKILLDGRRHLGDEARFDASKPRLLPVLVKATAEVREVFGEWIDASGLPSSLAVSPPVHEEAKPQAVKGELRQLLADRNATPEVRFRAARALTDLGEDVTHDLLDAVCQDDRPGWFTEDDHDWLLRHSPVPVDELHLRLSRSPHPQAYAPAVTHLLSLTEGDLEPIRAALLAFLEAGTQRMHALRVEAAAWLYRQGERGSILPILFGVAPQTDPPGFPSLFAGVPGPLLQAVVTGALMAGLGETMEEMLLQLLDQRHFGGPRATMGATSWVDPLARHDCLGQLLASATSGTVRQRARRSLRSGLGRSHKLRRVAETFAWGVRIGRQLTGKLFALEMIAGEDLGYTRLRENKLFISPMPLLRGQQNAREVVRGLILHEYGHHLYHKGESAEAVWEEAQRESMHQLLNLVSDEHLERNLRTRDAGFGDQLKMLGAFAFQHTAREVPVETLLNTLRGQSFAVLSQASLGVARKPDCVAVNSGRILQQMERAGVSFARFMRALRMGLGNRHNDPKVAQGLALFSGAKFRSSSMTDLMEIARKLREIFGDETDLLNTFNQDAAILADADDLADASEGISNEELQAEVRRAMEGQTGQPRRGGSSGGRGYNTAATEDFDLLTNVVPKVHDPVRHGEYAQRVARQAEKMRRYLRELGLGYRPQRMRVRGRSFDRTRARALVLRGDPRILLAREIHFQTDLFLGVLIDCSGSMSSDENIEKAKLFGTLLAEAARGNSGIDLRLWGFTDRTIYDCGNALRPAVHDLSPDDGNNDAAALWHAAQTARASRRKAKVLVMISDGSPTGCSVSALSALVKRLTTRMKMLCAQVAVRPLDDVCFPHHVLLDEGNLDEAVKRFGTVIMKLVRQALSG